MTYIEQKALALWNAVRAEREYTYEHTSINRHSDMAEALCRAIEQHEAFRQEVSKIVSAYVRGSAHDAECEWGNLDSLIIPAPKPDPLEEIIGELDDGTWGETKAEYADRLRAALGELGFEIREKNDD